MKNRIFMVILLVIILVSLTGCGNSNTKTLKCSATSSQEGRKTMSNLEVKIKNDEVKDMKLTLNIELPEDEQSYKQAMINQMRQKTNQVYITNEGIKAIFGMNSSYFDTLGVTTDASYSELKQVLELQGYSCEE